MGKQSTGRHRQQTSNKKKVLQTTVLAEQEPCVNDTVSVKWCHENGPEADYLGQVKGTANKTVTVQYYDDNQSHSHPLSNTQFKYDFSTEKSCLKFVTTFAASKRLTVADGALEKMRKLYLRLAQCKNKRKMFEGWRSVRDEFWTVFDESVQYNE